MPLIVSNFWDRHVRSDHSLKCLSDLSIKFQTDSSEDEVILVDDSPASESAEKVRIVEKKVLNVSGDKESSTEKSPILLTSDTSGGKSDREEIEDDPGLDSEQEDPTGSFFHYRMNGSVFQINYVSFLS